MRKNGLMFLVIGAITALMLTAVVGCGSSEEETAPAAAPAAAPAEGGEGKKEAKKDEAADGKKEEAAMEGLSSLFG